MSAAGFAPRLVCVAVDRMLDAVTAKEQQAVAELLVQLVKDATLARPDFLQGLHKHVDSLADLRWGRLTRPESPVPTCDMEMRGFRWGQFAVRGRVQPFCKGREQPDDGWDAGGRSTSCNVQAG